MQQNPIPLTNIKLSSLAGIYIHIPFCKQACHYCNFHFSTSLRLKADMVAAICTEIDLRKDELADKHLTSIYFGGGTPSLLEAADLGLIFDRLAKYYHWDEHTEITLEANPDDLTPAKIRLLARSPVNRLSIGIQSFDEEDLRYMNRAHSAAEAVRCIQNSQNAGMVDLSADLIYGSPTTSDEIWRTNIDQVIQLSIPHISAYALTVEEGTALHHFIKDGKRKAVDENVAARHFDVLVSTLSNHAYEHYEISNFALAGKRAVHNSNYWLGLPYMGIGPAAHSFDGIRTRSWNIAHNPQYITAISSGTLPSETERLTDDDAYNEYILIRLRTVWGVDIGDLMTDHTAHVEHFRKRIIPHIERGHVLYEDGTYVLSDAGKLLADKISMDLFYDDDIT